MEPITIFSRVHQALPVRPFTGALLVRAAALWMLVRVVFALGAAGLNQSLSHPELSDATDLALVTVVGIIVLTATLGLIDVRRRREHVLLANLGVGQAALGTLMLVPPVLLEVLMALATPF